MIPVGAYKATEPTIPTIEYIMGAPRQQVSIEHGGLGESTNIIVTAEDGSAESIYQLHFEAEASHCVNLTGIAVNGKPIAEFESHRRYYSIKTTDAEIVLTWASNDNFQTVTQIQESTLTFVPKIVGCVILLIFIMPWMMSVFISTVNEFMALIPQLIGAM